jgi:glutathione S-transferase
MTHVISAASTDQSFVEPHTNLLAYQKRCLDRPAWQKTIDAYRERVEPA